MMLLNPLWLILLIPAIVIAFFQVKSKGGKSALFYTNFENGREKSSYLYFAPHVIDFIAVVILIFALARPVSLEKIVSPPVEGKDIMFALDVSGSMEALDFQPKNRIETAKNVIESFVKGRTSDRIGLVFFAKESFLQVPLTTDYDIFIELLSRIKTGVIEDGTAIGNGLGLAVSRLESSSAKSKVVILLTDGDNNAGNISPLDAAEYAAEKGVKIYSILIGTDDEVPFPAGKDFFGRETFQKVKIKINPDLLKQISEKSKGKFYQSISTEELKKVFEEIDGLEKSPVAARKLKIYKEYASSFIVFAMALIMLARLFAMIFKVYPEVER
ncbi:MAG: VWA domain-containing protein [bacterium]